jgi:hypothetical protein
MTTMSLRASDADRDQVTTLLHAAYAEGRITDDELDVRTEAALQARTFDDLYAVTADLVPMVDPTPVVSSPAQTEPDRVVAIVGDTKRVGPWRVHPHTHIKSVVGAVELDLTEAIFETPVIEISCAVFAGEVTIRVNPGTNVQMLATGIIGETSVKNVGVPDPSMPTVVIKGTAVVGEISVRGPKRPPFWRRRVA